MKPTSIVAALFAAVLVVAAFLVVSCRELDRQAQSPPVQAQRDKNVQRRELVDQVSPQQVPSSPSITPAPLTEARARLAAEPEQDVEQQVHDARPPFHTEAYDHLQDNPFLAVTQNPLSTFSIDVDTASYSNVRRMLTNGQLPPAGAVRIEELVNYFTYDYPQPQGEDPFSISIDVTSCPWKPAHRLARVALKGREIRSESRPPCNLVFLLDVSGSMQDDNKLPLVKKGMKMLVEQLDERDRVAIVVYAGASGQVLRSTPCSEKRTIINALDRLSAGGSTNGGAGIHLAYSTAQENFIREGVNRVILCTDGDFNVGTTSQDQLVRLIEDKAKSGVFLTVLGFGMGNYKDSTLEKLADKGNGNYGYIDTEAEARKLLVQQLTGTLVTIAKDVKIQVEFNPAKVAAYRLIGYENRILAKEDFNDDTKDAGEIGAGHTVTALYELVPPGVEQDLTRPVDPLKYQTPIGDSATPALPAAGQPPSDETMTVKLRYKAPDGDTSKLISHGVVDEGGAFERAGEDMRFAAAVAGFGMILRNSPHRGELNLQAVEKLAKSSTGRDDEGLRKDFISLVVQARKLSSRD